jgi:hypothetical protein
MVVKRTVLAAVFAFLATAAPAQQPFVTLDEEPGGRAWWLRARYHPMHTAVRGIPVGDIRTDWCKATEFTRELFPQDLLMEGGIDALDYSHVSFSVEGRFDRSRTTQVALVGAYETCRGVSGGFLLVIDKDSRQIRFLEAGPHEHPFAALIAQQDATVRILYCLECDHSDVLRWNAKKKAFGYGSSARISRAASPAAQSHPSAAAVPWRSPPRRGPSRP